MARRRTHLLGLISGDFDDYFFTQVITGAEMEARRQGYFFLIGGTKRDEQADPFYVRLLVEQRVEGILFVRPNTEEDSHKILHEIGETMPVVTTGFAAGEKLSVVDVDNVRGGYQATHHLVQQGHERVGVITGPLRWRSAQDRLAGYRAALEEAGFPFREEWMGEGDWLILSGYEAMCRLLKKRTDITALFAHNDRMALGAIRALREAGRRVPEDVALVGYNDVPFATYNDPPLTTIWQPMREVGELATRLLIELVEDPEAENREVLLNTRLVVRNSCGAQGS